MGGCSSTESTAAVQPPARQHQQQNAQPRTRAKRNEMPESMVRVGSQVLKTSPGRSHLQAGRASTYDHVHNLVQINMDGRQHAGRVGLRNLGNTCFMNSSLQCLSNTIPMTDYCLGYDYRKEINHKNVLGTKGQLITSYTGLMKQVWMGRHSVVEPNSFYHKICQFAPQFAGGQQHDSQEFLGYLLDGIHEDLNRVQDKPYLPDKDCDGTNDEGDAILAWQNYLLRNRSIVVDLFQGQLRNTMTCRNQNKKHGGKRGCGHVNVRFEAFMYLSLPISSSTKTLEECLDLYCTEEYLTGDNQWYCPKCKTHVNATKKFDLWMLPPILIVHLKRFTGTGHKINTAIRYPVQNWNLRKAVKSKSGLEPVFDLYAVSNHSGNLGGGHYTAYCKNRFDEHWYEMNDSLTRPISQVGSNPSAYVLFYNRVECVGNRKRTDPKIRRQSIDRPEQWPHMQAATRTDFKSFTRVSMLPATTKASNAASEDTMPSIAEA